MRRQGGKPTGYYFTHIPDSVLYKFKALRGKPKHNTLWEGLALLAAFRLWLPALAHGSTFRARSDNLGFFKALAKGSARATDLNVLAQRRPSDPRLPGPLEHIPGVTNIQADALSRQFAPEAKSFPAELLDVPRFEVTFNADFWRVL